MKFLADENIPIQVVRRLREGGYIVWCVGEIEASIPDEEVLNLANEKEAVLLTGDKDFGELVYRQGLVTEGVILVRLSGLSTEEKAEVVFVAVDRYKEDFSGAFSVITPKNIRIRRNTS